MAAADGWRYIAQRVNGADGGLGDFLDLNVPLQGVNIEEVLSGHNALTGTITPEYPRLKGPDGRPILEEYGAAIWAESPDGELWGGLLTHSGFDEGGQWQVECTDLSVISIDLPFTDAVYFVNVDPTDLFRYVWRWIQGQPNSNLGISVDETTSPVRLGTDLIQRVEFDTEEDVSEDLAPAPAPVAPPRYATNKLWREAAVKIMKANGWNEKTVDDALRKWLNKDELVEQKKWEPLTEKERQIRDRAIEKTGWPPAPPEPGQKATSEPLVVNIRRQMNPPTGGGGGTVPETPEELEQQRITLEYDAYKLNWYTNHDLSGDLDALAADTPFDWHMVHCWEGDEIRHHIRLGYPRIGRRRDDLRFVVGENIHKAPSVERDGSEYANEVVVLGAGEGSTTIMGRAFRREDNRVRKVITISDPSITSQAAAIARAESELAKRFNIDNVAEVVVLDHPHARLTEVGLGDEVFIEGDIGWVEIASWCRVVSRTISPDDQDAMSLTLIRTDRIG